MKTVIQEGKDKMDIICRHGKAFIVEVLEVCDDKKQAKELLENIVPLSTEEKIIKLLDNKNYTDCSPEQLIENLKLEIMQLTPREQYVLYSHFGGNTLEQVAKEMNITRERVRQIEIKALARLKCRSRFIFVDNEMIQLKKERDEQIERLNEEIESIKQEIEELKNKSIEEKMEYKNLHYTITVEDMEFSVRTYHCLKRAGINTLEDLKEKTAEDLIRVKNLGRKSFKEVLEKMCELGCSLKGSYSDYLEEDDYEI